MGTDRREVVAVAPGAAADPGLREGVPRGPSPLDGARGGTQVPRQSPRPALLRRLWGDLRPARWRGPGHRRRRRGLAHGAAGVRASGDAPGGRARGRRAGAIPAVPRDDRERHALHRTVRDRVAASCRRSTASAPRARPAWRSSPPASRRRSIATAAGLGAAIPAVMGYNYFVEPRPPLGDGDGRLHPRPPQHPEPPDAPGWRDPPKMAFNARRRPTRATVASARRWPRSTSFRWSTSSSSCS